MRRGRVLYFDSKAPGLRLEREAGARFSSHRPGVLLRDLHGKYRRPFEKVADLLFSSGRRVVNLVKRVEGAVQIIPEN